MRFPRNRSPPSPRSKAFGEFGITVVSRNYNILLNRPKAFLIGYHVKKIIDVYI